jgi:hypothetical protein
VSLDGMRRERGKEEKQEGDELIYSMRLVITY